jgi:hypothetical protein
MKIQLLGSRFHQRADSDAPDLHTQLESLFDCVWRAEAMWSLEDRVSMAIRFEHHPANDPRADLQSQTETETP